MAARVPGKTMDWNRPIFHVRPWHLSSMASIGLLSSQASDVIAPNVGWLNDPNGPICYKGKTHIFYQHVKDKPNWDWGILWGHASSEDLVQWTRMPTALTPSPRGADTSGCWSGCVTFDKTGQAHALYTGVRLKGAPYDGPKTEEYAPTEPMIESIMCSTCTAASEDLKDWTAGDTIVAAPPAELMAAHGPLEGWRDPFIISTHQSGGKIQMILGSGFQVDGAKNGCILLYTADEPAGPWQYKGIIASGVVQIPPHASPGLFNSVKVSDANLARDCVFSALAAGEMGKSHGLHMLLYGAYESTQQNPSWHWDPVMFQLGQFDGSLFHPQHAAVRLDIGDAPYAANVHIDTKGRVILWLWLRDPRPAPPVCAPSDMCGCLAIPRMLSYIQEDGQPIPVVFQQPVPEASQLRGAQKTLGIPSEQTSSVDSLQRLHTFDSSHFEAKLTFSRDSASVSGILLTVDSSKENGLLVLILWETDEWVWIRGDAAKLQSMPVHVDSLLRDINTSLKSPLDMQIQSLNSTDMDPKQVMELQLFVDGSAVEIFTSSGKAASTRLYGKSGGTLHGVSCGGRSGVTGALWQMKSCWKEV